MINIKSLDFKNIDKIEFFKPTGCEDCCEENDLGLVALEGYDISDAVNSLLLDLNCNTSGALVLKKSGLGVIFISTEMFLGEKQENISFVQLGPKENDTRDSFIEKFVNCVNKYNLDNLIILEEAEYENAYKFVY